MSLMTPLLSRTGQALPSAHVVEPELQRIVTTRRYQLSFFQPVCVESQVLFHTQAAGAAVPPTAVQLVLKVAPLLQKSLQAWVATGGVSQGSVAAVFQSVGGGRSVGSPFQ